MFNERDISVDTAVWDGRFQPFHIGHLEVMKAILEQFQCNLVVMIIQSSEGHYTKYSEEVNKHHLLSRNPLTFWERYNLIKLALKEAKVLDRVDIVGIPRPDLYWDIASKFYPDKRFICLTGKDEYERKKEEFWNDLGEDTKTIDISRLPKISATGFKMALKEEKEWKKFLPKGTEEYFKEIEAPKRFINSDVYCNRIELV